MGSKPYALGMLRASVAMLSVLRVLECFALRASNLLIQQPLPAFIPVLT